jgi:hypothetical protein
VLLPEVTATGGHPKEIGEIKVLVSQHRAGRVVKSFSYPLTDPWQFDILSMLGPGLWGSDEIRSFETALTGGPS